MILVDTSVFINFFRGTGNEKVQKLEETINRKIPFGICDLVYQELLQGTKSEKEFGLLKAYLETQRFYSLKNGLKSYDEAAMNYVRCRRKGITVRSSMDMIIAQIAIENDLFLLHDDADFHNMAGVMDELKEC